MKKQLLLVMLCAGMFCGTKAKGQEAERLSGYVQAERFTKEKLNTMLFSTSVDPHWFRKGSSFWYEYKTGNGKVWYVVDPVAKTKRPLFDLDDIAAQITEIVKDPFTAQQLPIQKLEAGEDGRTFTFQITSSQEAKKDSTDKDKGPKKEIFFFSYDYPTRKLTWLKEKKKETEYPDWASFSPDGKTVVYAKDLNLYRMSREDYEKLKKDDKDSTVTDIQLTTFGVKDFGFGQPYSLLNTDTLCNGKRKGVWGIVWSPDSRYFAVTVEDERAVKDLWVINSMASPRPTLETYKYQMPGEKEAPVPNNFLISCTVERALSVKLTNVFPRFSPIIVFLSSPEKNMKISSKDDSRRNRYLLDFPNNEVKKGFLTMVAANYFKPQEFEVSNWIVDAVILLEEGETTAFCSALTSFLADIPYDSHGSIKTVEATEKHFQYTFYLILRLLGVYCLLHVEKTQSRGRVDCVLETKDYVYIFEFKLDGTAAEALQQIEDKGYATPYQTDTRKVTAIGVSFSSETMTVEEWEEKTL